MAVSDTPKSAAKFFRGLLQGNGITNSSKIFIPIIFYIGLFTTSISYSFTNHTNRRENNNVNFR